MFVSLGNLARQRPVWEDNPWLGTEDWRATKAVDGRYNDRSAAGGQCVISENERKTAPWRVDLRDTLSALAISKSSTGRTIFQVRNTYILLNCHYKHFYWRHKHIESGRGRLVRNFDKPKKDGAYSYF